LPSAVPAAALMRPHLRGFCATLGGRPTLRRPAALAGSPRGGQRHHLPRDGHPGGNCLLVRPHRRAFRRASHGKAAIPVSGV